MKTELPLKVGRRDGPLKHFPTMKEDDPDPRNGPVRVLKMNGKRVHEAIAEQQRQEWNDTKKLV